MVIKLKDLLQVVSGVDCFVNDDEIGYFTSSENSYPDHMEKYFNYIVEHMWVVGDQQETIIKCDLIKE